MSGWNGETLEKIAGSDDLHIAPLRGDGVTPGTPTWIWSVVVDGALYVRAYHGQQSRWYQAAMRQHAGRIVVAGTSIAVSFSAVTEEDLNRRIDEAYRRKYASSPYLSSMTGDRARAACILVTPPA